MITWTCCFCFRYDLFLKFCKIIQQEGSIDTFTQGYNEFGLHIRADGSILWKEWAPGAEALFLRGDFSNFLQMFCGLEVIGEKIF